MVDESDEVKAPITGVRSAPQVDEGLVAWADLLQDSLATQGGLEIIGRSGGSVHFKFRGQTFAVTIQRVS